MFYRGGVVANAELVKISLRKAKSYKPSHRDIWIRLDDQWWPGQIFAWLDLDDQWIASAQHDRPGMATQVGNYWYDRTSIRPRAGDEKPPE